MFNDGSALKCYHKPNCTLTSFDLLPNIVHRYYLVLCRYHIYAQFKDFRKKKNCSEIIFLCTFKFSRMAGQWSSGTSSWILITKSVYPPCGVILTPDDAAEADVVEEDHIVVTAVKNNNVKVKPILGKHTRPQLFISLLSDDNGPHTWGIVKSLKPQFGTAGSIQLTPEKKIRLVCVLYYVCVV